MVERVTRDAEVCDLNGRKWPKRVSVEFPPHDASVSAIRVSHLGVILHVPRVERDGFQVQLAIQVHGRDDVPVRWGVRASGVCSTGAREDLRKKLSGRIFGDGR